MRLSSKPIITFGTINIFQYGNQWTVRSGDPATLYFQLVDLDQAVPIQSNTFFSGLSNVGNLYGLRYLAGLGVSNQPYSLTVTFPSVDDTKVITVAAVQADANDSSIWKVTLLPNQLPASGNVQFTLTEGTNVHRWFVVNLLAVEQSAMCGGA